MQRDGKKESSSSPSNLLPLPSLQLLPHLSTYSPLSWKTQPLHLLPSPSPCSTLQPSGPFPTLKLSPTDKEALDWIFFVSSLNFSFWSELPSGQRWGVEWCENGWEGVGGNRKRWEGYWGLLAVVNSGELDLLLLQPSTRPLTRFLLRPGFPLQLSNLPIPSPLPLSTPHPPTLLSSEHSSLLLHPQPKRLLCSENVSLFFSRTARSSASGSEDLGLGSWKDS